MCIGARWGSGSGGRGSPRPGVGYGVHRAAQFSLSLTEFEDACRWMGSPARQGTSEGAMWVGAMWVRVGTRRGSEGGRGRDTSEGGRGRDTEGGGEGEWTSRAHLYEAPGQGRGARGGGQEGGAGCPISVRSSQYVRKKRFDLICNAQRRVSTRPSHAPASSRHVECTRSLKPITAASPARPNSEPGSQAQRAGRGKASGLGTYGSYPPTRPPAHPSGEAGRAGGRGEAGRALAGTQRACHALQARARQNEGLGVGQNIGFLELRHLPRHAPRLNKIE
jgi:hypothetical protein